MHIFLTGEKQVGKSTIIKKYLAKSGKSADGYITYWTPEVNDKQDLQDLRLAPFNTGLQRVKSHIVAQRNDGRMIKPENIAGVFDLHGCDILSKSGKKDLIIMDELGFLEAEAIVFQGAVMRLIDSSKPILGVIKPIRSEFLDKIRAHPNVELVEVTVENRDEVLNQLLKTVFECDDFVKLSNLRKLRKL